MRVKPTRKTSAAALPISRAIAGLLVCSRAARAARVSTLLSDLIGDLLVELFECCRYCKCRFDALFDRSGERGVSFL